LRDDIDRLFDLTLRGFGENTFGAWAPAVDVHEDESGLTFSAEIAGMKKEDIKVDVENNVLTLSGERKFESEEQGKNFHLVERGYGSFRRSFSLPATVDPQSADATYKDGLLTVRFAKRPEVRGRTVEIK
jgi:HSP20 family protein